MCSQQRSCIDQLLQLWPILDHIPHLKKVIMTKHIRESRNSPALGAQASSWQPSLESPGVQLGQSWDCRGWPWGWPTTSPPPPGEPQDTRQGRVGWSGGPLTSFDLVLYSTHQSVQNWGDERGWSHKGRRRNPATPWQGSTEATMRTRSTWSILQSLLIEAGNPFLANTSPLKLKVGRVATQTREGQPLRRKAPWWVPPSHPARCRAVSDGLTPIQSSRWWHLEEPRCLRQSKTLASASHS